MTDIDLRNPQGIAWMCQPQEWQNAMRAHAKAGGEVAWLDHAGGWFVDPDFNPVKFPGIAYRAVLPPATYDPEAVEALVKAAEAFDFVDELYDEIDDEALLGVSVPSSNEVLTAITMGAFRAITAALTRIKGGAK